MYLNIRFLFLLLIYTSVGYTQTGKQIDTTSSTLETKGPNRSSNPHDYGTFFEINYLRPIAGDDYFLKEGYKIDSGIGLTIGTSLHNITLQGEFRVATGQVTRPELVGNALSSTINRYSVGLGYVFYITNRFAIHPSIHYGGLVIRHTFENGSSRNKVRDDGYFIGIKAQVNYELLSWLSITAGIQQNIDRLAIEAPIKEDTFFSNGTFLTPSVGLHFRIARRNKIPDAPGDGIFSRRDGL